MINIGVICPSEIAFRRFMPALQLVKGIKFIGIGISSVEERFEDSVPSDEILRHFTEDEHRKANRFIDLYGGKIFESYYDIATSDEIDALYIPLPPALHYKWAKIAMEYGKHVLIEKPFTITFSEAADLIECAMKKNLAVHENYMFIFHEQLKAIENMVQSGEIGDIRLYRISFGFPERSENDFRYNKKLGGGALNDAGGYTIKCAAELLGKTAKIRYAQMNYVKDLEVDLYGSAALSNDAGMVAQISFGMDNDYKCELEVWGSKGTLTTGRILTAPAGFVPTVSISKGNKEEIRNLPADDTFKKSIERFLECIQDKNMREINFAQIVKQSELVEEFKKLADHRE